MHTLTNKHTHKHNLSHSLFLFLRHSHSPTHTHASVSTSCQFLSHSFSLSLLSSFETQIFQQFPSKIKKVSISARKGKINSGKRNLEIFFFFKKGTKIIKVFQRRVNLCKTFLGHPQKIQKQKKKLGKKDRFKKGLQKL